MVAKSPENSKGIKARDFVITLYFSDQEGYIRPKKPLVGPCREVSKKKCHICLDHYRQRKTGPSFPVGVFRCLSHNRLTFTAYPPGYMPYSRIQLLPTSFNGSLRRSHEKGQKFSDSDLSSTYFGAAIDAKNKQKWLRDPREFKKPPQRKRLSNNRPSVAPESEVCSENYTIKP